MQISGKTLYSFISNGDIKKAGLPSFRSVQSTIHRHYCDKLTLANKCPLECNKCRAVLSQAVTGIDPKKAKSPMAVLTYLLRNARSRVIEVQHTATIKKDRYGIPVEGNYLDHLLAELAQ